LRDAPEAGGWWAVVSGPPGSQKVTSGVPLATMAAVKVAWKVRHSACVAVVMLSPDHAEAMRWPVGVQPGQAPFMR
jgi:hypothetical protein